MKTVLGTTMLLLLSLATAVGASASDARTVIFPVSTHQIPRGFPMGILPSPFRTDPELRACWSPVRRVPGCAYSVFGAVTGELLLRADCCDAVTRLTKCCSEKIFSTAPLRPEHHSLVEEFCGSIDKDAHALIPLAN